MHFKYAIIGGGLAAGYAAQKFAEAGLSPQQVAIFSEERLPPYERPPLSKDFLAGEEEAEETLINDPDFYTDNQIELFLKTRVTAVDLDARQLTTDNGAFTFDKLLITTGSRARAFDLPGAGLAGIHYLRRLPDAQQIREEMANGDRAVVIGGSFIGMEVASVLAQAGLETTLTFPESRVWEAFFTPKMSEFFETYYKKRGVAIVPGTKIKSFTGKDGRIQAVKLANGQSLPADFVVAGIGVVPNVELFSKTPLKIKEGILVNRFLETNVPGVYAAGDVAEYHDVMTGKTRRLEHWDNAYRQGQHAASVMLGEQSAYKEVRYFFSDVFDLSYELWGDPSNANQIVHRGDVMDGRFSVWWIRDNKLAAAFVMDRPEQEREVAPKWIESGIPVNAERLADSDQPIQAAVADAVAITA